MRTVGIVIFDDVEVLDACGPFEVFSVTRALGPGREETPTPLFHVLMLAETASTVTCVGGLQIVPQATFAEHPPLDLLIIPGGHGARHVQQHNPVLLDWMVAQQPSVEILASVCTGAFVLAARGLLDGRRATTHWARIETLRAQFPRVTVLSDVRYVDEGAIITSAGISAGIDMSLHLVARLHGHEIAAATARRMEYDWAPPTAPQG
jgi:transcriptional regulator GlxA family with amidase domain